MKRSEALNNETIHVRTKLEKRKPTQALLEIEFSITFSNIKEKHIVIEAEPLRLQL